MRPSQLLESLAIGASIAAIPGPIFFELTRRTLTHGLWSGICLAVGEFAGNLSALLIVAFGLSGLLTSAVAQLSLSLAGAGVLLWLGVSTWRFANTDSMASRPSCGQNRNSVSTGFAIALSSPIVIALWVSLSSSYLDQIASPTAVLLNAFLIAFGFIVLFVPLAVVIHRARVKLPQSLVSASSKILGSILIAYGISFAGQFGRLAIALI